MGKLRPQNLKKTNAREEGRAGPHGGTDWLVSWVKVTVSDVQIATNYRFFFFGGGVRFAQLATWGGGGGGGAAELVSRSCTNTLGSVSHRLPRQQTPAGSMANDCPPSSAVSGITAVVSIDHRHRESA